MSMNIKSPEAHALARQLAAVTGESVTAAVTTAVRERLERVTAMSDDLVAGRRQKISQLAAEIRANAGPDAWPDHGDLLYDAKGLPR